jgi:hypothetical protein
LLLDEAPCRIGQPMTLDSRCGHVRPPGRLERVAQDRSRGIRIGRRGAPDERSALQRSITRFRQGRTKRQRVRHTG